MHLATMKTPSSSSNVVASIKFALAADPDTFFKAVIHINRRGNQTARATLTFLGRRVEAPNNAQQLSQGPHARQANSSHRPHAQSPLMHILPFWHINLHPRPVDKSDLLDFDSSRASAELPQKESNSRVFFGIWSHSTTITMEAIGTALALSRIPCHSAQPF